MMWRTCVITCALLFSASALASDFDYQLGTVLGSETFCGLSLNQDAIRLLIEQRVKPDDLDFAGNLQAMTSGTEAENENMTSSQKTARCTQVKRSAKAFGLLLK